VSKDEDLTKSLIRYVESVLILAFYIGTFALLVAIS
jgi:hypothetical protein